ncbi:MAG: hypothetical protein ACI9ES_003268 [Oceanospirillaceae bacterium]|jgi:hypothetical protein
MIEASCHCGKVNIKVPDSTTKVTSCNCSICRRFGTLWAHFDPKTVIINCDESELGTYSWGDKSINFHHCKDCGCVTHYSPTETGNQQRMAVNFRLVSLEVLNAIQIRYLDGADTWAFVEK